MVIEWWQTILISAAASVVTWFLSKKKSDAELLKTAVETKGDEILNIKNIVSVWAELVVGLRAEILSLKGAAKETIDKLMAQIVELNEAVSKLTAENTALNKEIKELKDMISSKFK